MCEKKIHLAFAITLSLVILSGLVSASTTITDTSIGTSGNLTLGQKITFTLGEVVDNIIDGWITVTGNFNVTGNATVSGTSFKVNNKEVCLADGTNCQPSNGSGYVSLYSSGNFNGSLYTAGADSTASSSNSIFQVIGSDGTPRFQVQNGGDGQASFVAKSFLVVNQNSTRLNQSQNNLCSDWGFAQIDCNSSTTGADMGVQDDFEVGGLIYANQGMSSNTPDWGSYLFLGNLTTYASGGTNGIFIDASNTFCDIISNPFTQEQVGNGTWIQITDGNYEGAMADMKVFINSSCVRLAGNPSWINNLTNQTFRILPRPVQIVTDGGYSEFYVGPGLQGKFEVNVENGSDLYGMHLDDTAGKSQHKAMVVDIDAGNNTGIVGENIFLTSSGGSFLDLVGLLMEVNPINLDNSDYSHLEFHNLAPLGTNNIRLMDIFGSYSELMRHGETEVIDYVGYYNGATLTNITTNATSSSLNMEIFSNDNDELYFCDSNNLSEISINLQTPLQQTWH